MTIDVLLHEFFFWTVWLIIPLLIDLFTGFGSAIVVWRAYFRKKETELTFFPYVTILIPVYNSEKTLRDCLQSIINQQYPLQNIQVILIDNGSEDESFEVFQQFQMEQPILNIRYIKSTQGKAQALNQGIYLSRGRYILNIDSDGMLDTRAVYNTVRKFEEDVDIAAMTGVVMINPQFIQENSKPLLKLLQRCELFEYVEAFLVGRGYQSNRNSIFTLAGAFSAFRKEVLTKTQMYNIETLGEDTHMTTQIRLMYNGKVALCEDAFFYVDPIESVDRLYMQRQRWQRGGIEVTALFNTLLKKKMRGSLDVIRYTMIKDHTLIFSRMIWIFALVYLMFLDYPLYLIVTANIILYFAYVANSVLFYLVSKLYLKSQPKIKKYMRKHLYTVFLLPFYRMFVFFCRIAGTINAKEERANWNTRTLNEEMQMISERIKKRFSFYFKLKKWMNGGDSK
ncbi:TIGR03111 family XrtG-associated glycosyltransferase [Bacillus thuringiensis]